MEGFLGYFSGGMSDGFLWRHLKYRIFFGGGGSRFDSTHRFLDSTQGLTHLEHVH